MFYTNSLSFSRNIWCYEEPNRDGRDEILTEKQERLLWLALKMGFLDYPRKINAVELSRRVGIRASTLSEITRRGIHRLLEQHFET